MDNLLQLEKQQFQREHVRALIVLFDMDSYLFLGVEILTKRDRSFTCKPSLCFSQNFDVK